MLVSDVSGWRRAVGCAPLIGRQQPVGDTVDRSETRCAGRSLGGSGGQRRRNPRCGWERARGEAGVGLIYVCRCDGRRRAVVVVVVDCWGDCRAG